MNSKSWLTFLWVCLLLLFPSTGCLNLDFMLHNGIHCSKINEKTCNKSNEWDKVCVSCDTPYNFSKTFPWMSQTLKTGETIRPIDNTKVVRYQLKTTDGLGELDAYFIPSHGENPLLAKTTILYSHGNYASIEHYIPRLQFLHEAGYNIAVWDYRGYGKSMPASAPSPQQFLADSKQIREEASKWVPDPNKIVVYGYSLGGIPAVEMSVQKPGCALLLEAPFPSVRSLVRSASTTNMPDGFFSQGYFNNIEKIKNYKGSILLMIGTIDNKFTVRDEQELFDQAPGPKEFWKLEGIDHGISNGGIPEASYANYKEKLLSFLKTKASNCLQP